MAIVVLIEKQSNRVITLNHQWPQNRLIYSKTCHEVTQQIACGVTTQQVILLL